MTPVGPGSAAIILAGGRARRLGGADKPLVPVAGRPLIAHALEAAARRDRIIVVGGPFEIGDDRITWTREDPPFGGPAAAVLAGIGALGEAVDETEVLLLASDLPDAARLVGRLDARPIPADADGLVALDDSGREQWLAARYRLGALRRAARDLAEPGGTAMRVLLGPLSLRTVDVGRSAVDLDTWDAIDEYRRAHPAPQQKDQIMHDTPADLESWVRSAAAELGLDPEDVPIGLLLDVTRETAHQVMRPAGPVTTFLLGLAVGRGGDLDDAVTRVRALIAEWPSEGDAGR